MSLLIPSRFDAKAIFVPSQDHAGNQSFFVANVSCRAPLPSAFITKRWALKEGPAVLADGAERDLSSVRRPRGIAVLSDTVGNVHHMAARRIHEIDIGLETRPVVARALALEHDGAPEARSGSLTAGREHDDDRRDDGADMEE